MVPRPEVGTPLCSLTFRHELRDAVSLTGVTLVTFGHVSAARIQKQE